jgi:aminoglycoside 2''-phosphotransferase
MDHNEVSNAVIRGCPEWKVDSIRYLGEGDFCLAYVVNDEWILRVGKHEAARQSLRREYCLLPRLASQFALQIPSPQVACLDQSNDLPFIAYPLLPGPSLSQERYKSLDPAARTRCARQVAGFLTQLHAVDLATARACGVIVQGYAAHYGGLLLRARAELYPSLDEPEREFIERTIGSYLDSGDAIAFDPALLHGDLSPAHVLFDEESESVTAIIDFGDMVIGDPAWDLVFIYEDYGLDFLSRLLDAYCDRDRASLLGRVFQFYLMAAIDWTVGARARGDCVFAEALAELPVLRLQEERQREELFSCCGAI